MYVPSKICYSYAICILILSVSKFLEIVLFRFKKSNHGNVKT